MISALKKLKPQSKSKLYSVSKAAKLLSISPTTLRRWEKQGRFKTRRTSGKQRRFTLDDLKNIGNNHCRYEHRPKKSSSLSLKTASYLFFAFCFLFFSFSFFVSKCFCQEAKFFN